MDIQKYMCSLCREKFGFDDIRYSLDGKRLVCKECFNRSAKAREDIEIIQETKKSDKIKVICIDCRYKFSLSRDYTGSLTCPYCGKGRLMKDEATAEKLIKEVSENPDKY